jgi:2-polyprenyl-3-methyl-5-hydroxy-6-metoxy-1,4-benzoquinol methylase
MKFNCGLCGSNKNKIFNKKDAKSFENLKIAICLNCSLVQQEKLPNDEALKIYYSHNYREDYKKTYTPKLKHIRRAGLEAKSRISFIKNNIRNISNMKLLDVGAGGGEFLYLASKNGFDAQGIEPNVGYSRFARDEYGVNVKTLTLNELKADTVNIITLFHVFEHIANPQKAIEKLSYILKKDGYLLIEVPNIFQQDASPHNIFFKAHLFYYSKYTLISAASKFFDVVQIDDKGNLKILFKKKNNSAISIRLPSKTALDETFKRLNQKGWLEYLTIGGGLLKPFKKIKQKYCESLIKNLTPKKLLDSL